MEEQFIKILTYGVGLMLALSALTLFFVNFDAMEKVIHSVSREERVQKGMTSLDETGGSYTGEEIICMMMEHYGLAISIDQGVPFEINENTLNNAIQSISTEASYTYQMQYEDDVLTMIYFRKE